MNVPDSGSPMDDDLEICSPMDYSPDTSSPTAPKATSQILVTNMDPAIFVDRDLMDAFENLLHECDTQCRIFYFKSFLRARVDMNSIEKASLAKKHLHGFRFANRFLECYFFRDLFLGRRNFDLLELPPLEKQYLISPPVSPPLGWEPAPEGEPIIDLNLIAALATLRPGEIHQLHPGREEKNIPSIVLQPCLTDLLDTFEREGQGDESEGGEDVLSRKVPRPQIVQTRRPPDSLGQEEETDWTS